MGSGDPYGRQLDGMGAGISSLSKICLVEPYGKRIVKADRGLRFRTGHGGIDAARDSAEAAQALEAAEDRSDIQPLDIDYTFVGLGIENNEVDVAGNCGNMSSAIGPYAYNAGLLPPHFYDHGNKEVTVKIRNTNTGKLIDSTFEVLGGEALVVGNYSIDGVTGPGAKVKLDFKSPFGSKTGRLLPTGKKVNIIEGYKVSCIDGANPAIFIRADDVGVDGAILPNDFNKQPDKLDLLERIRKAAAVAMGIAPTEDQVPRTIPKIGLVSQSSTHRVLSGQTLNASQVDIVVRFLSDTQPHRAIPLTAALTTAVAARIPGSIVEQLISSDPVMKDAITIGHASGKIEVNATMDEKHKNTPLIATVYRTAKRLFEGKIFYTQKEEDIMKPTINSGGYGKATTNLMANYGSGGRHSLGHAFVLENRGQSSSHLFDRDTKEELEEQQPQDQDLPEIHLESERSYRPLPDLQIRERPGVHPRVPETPLTTALQRLQAHISSMLSDPDFARRPYPPDLRLSVENAFLRITANSRGLTQTFLGKEWHDWAKKIHKRTKGVREYEKKKARWAEREALGFKRTTRREVGLSKDGDLMEKEDWAELDRQRRKTRNHARIDWENEPISNPSNRRG